jgi:hypothetical protein
MHIVSVTLDSMGPAVYIVFGLILILGSSLLRRYVPRPALQVVVEKPEDIEVRTRSEKVVPINRNSRVSKCAAIPGRRVGNLS